MDINAVFKQVSEEFNFEYKIFPEMQNTLITVSFEKVSLLEGIKNIVKENYLLELKSSEKITKIYVVNRSNKDFEERNTQVESFINKKLLSLDQLKEIITRNVRKEYPTAQLFTTIPHEDIKGNLRSYIFSYYIGSGNMPSLDKVKADINEAWEFKKEARENISEAYKNRDSSTMIEWIEKSKPYEKKLSETESYITLEGSATYDEPPVMKFYKGIPYDLSMYPNAVELLKKRIKDISGINFTRTFIIDTLAIGFEFRNEKNGTIYWVDVLGGTVFDRWEENKRVKKQKDIPEKRESIKKQWESFLEL